MKTRYISLSLSMYLLFFTHAPIIHTATKMYDADHIESYRADVLFYPIVVDTSLLQANGHLTEQSLPLFLTQAYNEKKLFNADFKKTGYLTAKNLGKQGGYTILQLFLVTAIGTTASTTQYIVKESRKGIEEAIKLKTIAQLPKIKDIIAPKVKAGLPSIIVPFAYLTYTDNKRMHYIMVMPLAQGRTFNELILLFNDNQTPHTRKLLSRAFYILGQETANFHQLFSQPHKDSLLGVTSPHGDFHFFNLFFDEINDHCTFIDNETLAKSITRKASPAVDIVKLFLLPFSISPNHQQFRDLIKKIDLKTWHNITLKNFVLGYTSTYTKKQQLTILKELKKMFNDPIAISWAKFEHDQLQKLKTLYINPMFDELIQSKKQQKNNSIPLLSSLFPPIL